MTINDRMIQEVVIDSHVDKHSDHINDELILEIVQLLAKNEFEETDHDNGFTYFVSFVEHCFYFYRVVWLFECDMNYIGIITVFRDKKAQREK